MAYECRQCKRIGKEAGACPVCNIPMDIRLQDDQPVTDAPAEGAPATDAPAEGMPADQPMEAPAAPAPEAPAAPAPEAPAAPAEETPPAA